MSDSMFGRVVFMRVASSKKAVSTAQLHVAQANVTLASLKTIRSVLRFAGNARNSAEPRCPRGSFGKSYHVNQIFGFPQTAAGHFRLKQLCSFLRIPSVSADSAFAPQMKICAEW